MNRIHQRKKQFNSVFKSALFVTFLIVIFLGLMLVSNTFFKPNQANFEFLQIEDVKTNPTIKRHTKIKSLNGAISHAEIPKTGDHHVNDLLDDFVLAHQDAYFSITQKNSNRLKQKGRSSHRILFDWIVVDENIASVVFYEHWSVEHVAHRFTMDSFLIDFSSSMVYNSKDLIDPEFINTTTSLQRMESYIHKKGLSYASDSSLKETIARFVHDGVFVIERDTLKILGTDHNLKNNVGGLTSISLPLRSVSSIMTPTLLQLLPVRENQTKQIAFTFDDGPNRYTKEVLDVLKKHDAIGTFFVLGMQVEMYPELAKQIVEDGHEIANHSYSHKDLVKVSAAEATAQISRTNKIIKDTTGVTVKLLRPPYGRYNQKVRTYTNLRITLWNVDPLD